MMGFLGKLGLVVLVVAVVWVVFKVMARPAPGKGPVRGQARRQQGSEIEDMRACSRCGTYVPAKGARACERRDCPLLPGV